MFYQEIKQPREPESKINQILEITDRELGITMFDMLNDRTNEKISNIYKQMGNFLTEMRIMRVKEKC